MPLTALTLCSTERTLSQTTNFGLLQTERVADDNLYFHVNDRKFSKGLENTVGK